MCDWLAMIPNAEIWFWAHQVSSIEFERLAECAFVHCLTNAKEPTESKGELQTIKNNEWMKHFQEFVYYLHFSRNL